MSLNKSMLLLSILCMQYSLASEECKQTMEERDAQLARRLQAEENTVKSYRQDWHIIDPATKQGQQAIKNEQSAHERLKSFSYFTCQNNTLKPSKGAQNNVQLYDEDKDFEIALALSLQDQQKKKNEN